MLDVLAVGELNPDLVIAQIAGDAPRLGTEQVAASCRLTLGSSTAICTVAMQRLGLRTALVARIGDDDFGRFCTDFLAREGIGIEWIHHAPEVATGVTVALSYPSDRLLVTYAGAMETLASGDVPDAAIARARHMHVSSFFLQRALQPGLDELFARARRAGLTTSLDTGWDPSGAWDVERLGAVLAHTDVFLPNETELLHLSRAGSVDEGGAWGLAQGAGTVVVKLGSKGAASYAASGRTSHPGFRIEPVDTTGAGDAFDAGYLYGLLMAWNEEERLRFGNACGAMTASAIGGTGGVDGLDGVLSFLASREEKLQDE